MTYAVDVIKCKLNVKPCLEIKHLQKVHKIMFKYT